MGVEANEANAWQLIVPHRPLVARWNELGLGQAGGRRHSSGDTWWMGCRLRRRRRRRREGHPAASSLRLLESRRLLLPSACSGIGRKSDCCHLTPQGPTPNFPISRYLADTLSKVYNFIRFYACARGSSARQQDEH